MEVGVSQTLHSTANKHFLIKPNKVTLDTNDTTIRVVYGANK